MSFFGDLLGAAGKALSGIVGGGGGSSPVSGLLDKAGDALGGLIGDVTGDKLGDKIGDKIGDLFGSDKIGDKLGDFIGNAIGGESKVTDFLASKSEAIGDKLGDLVGSDKAGDIFGSVIGGMTDEQAGQTTPEQAEAKPVGQETPEEVDTKPVGNAAPEEAEEASDTIDLSRIGELPEDGDLPDVDADFNVGSPLSHDLPGTTGQSPEPVPAMPMEPVEPVMTPEQMLA